jgi:Leucine-rich repeat (LRR) protein
MRKSNIRFIPTAIGKLDHLQELNLTETNTAGIPTKILVGCKHLKVLNLSYTQNLLRLPDEIGNLSELRELYLGHSAIQSLPHYSVLAKLVKLEILDLSGTSDLRKFENHPALDQGFTLVDNHTSKSQPGNLDASGGEKFRSVDLAGNGEEKLKRLRRLYLRHSAILKGSPLSPPLWKDESFRRFFMSSELLCDLDLSGAKCFGLSDIVRDSNSLEKINLSFTDIATLPQSSSAVYDKLARLKVLSLTSTPVLRKYPQQAKKKPSRSCTLVTEGPPLRDLVLGRHSKLGCIGLKPYQTDGFLQHRTIRRALALNRARFRMASIAWIMAAHESPTKTARGGNRRRHQQPFPPRALWPILLSARRAVDIFRPYEECCDKSCDCHVLPHETDALFDILVTFGHEIFGDRQRVSATHNNRSSKDDSVSAFDSDGFVLVDDWTPTKY